VKGRIGEIEHTDVRRIAARNGVCKRGRLTRIAESLTELISNFRTTTNRNSLESGSGLSRRAAASPRSARATAWTGGD